MTSHGSTDRDDPTTDQTVFVRPIGHVEGHAVARRVGDRKLFVGNVLAADPNANGDPFDFILSLSGDDYPLTTHHRPLHDGPGNEWTAFESAVDTARELHGRDGSLLVHCRAGISRSVTVVATAVAAEEGRAFVDALHEVQDARPHGVSNPALHELGVVYLAVEGVSTLTSDEA